MSGPHDVSAAAPAQFAVLAALLAGSGAIWYIALQRWARGEPVVRLARRRPVPWQATDVVIIVLTALALIVLTAQAAKVIWPASSKAPDADAERSADHPAEQLLRSGDSRKIALAAVMAVIVAPAYEEFLFRVLLQGWLEAVWSRARRKHRELRSAPASWVPLLLPAVLFAAIHFHAAAPPQSSDYLSRMFAVQMVAEVATIVVAVALLRAIAGAKATDFGWLPEKLGKDVPLALAALVAVTPLLLVAHSVLSAAFTHYHIPFAPDPIPLFFLALVFGLLYRRTHRIAPSMLMHAAFNATSLLLFFLRP